MGRQGACCRSWWAPPWRWGPWGLAALGRPDLAFSAGLFAAAAANRLVGRRLDGQAGRELVDPATQERVVPRRRHRLFRIDTEYWSVPVALAALVPLLSLLNLGRG